jgi:hypothetical protein
LYGGAGLPTDGDSIHSTYRSPSDNKHSRTAAFRHGSGYGHCRGNCYGNCYGNCRGYSHHPAQPDAHGYRYTATVGLLETTRGLFPGGSERLDH